ncbi:seed maturation protein [Tanacetum coccineum]
MQTTNAAASIKETTANIGASTKTSMEKTKATLQKKNIDNFLTGVKPYYGSTSVKGGIQGRFASDTTSARQAANIGVKAMFPDSAHETLSQKPCQTFKSIAPLDIPSSHVAAAIVANSKRLTWSCDIVRNEKAAENRPSSSVS